MADDETPVVRWAEQVGESGPPALVHVEDALLLNVPVNRKRLQEGLRGAFWPQLWLTVFALLSAAPLAAPIVFGSGRYWGTTREYDGELAYPVAATVSWIGIVVLGIFYVRWRRQEPVRLRDANGSKLAVVYVVSDLLALWFASDKPETFDGSTGWYMVPMWTLLPLSVLSAIYQLRSPRDPVSENRIPISRIREGDRARLLQERDQALRTLERRGLLESGTPEDLALRPLGELHISP